MKTEERKMYKIKGQKKTYETPFDLMENEYILNNDASMREFERGDSDITFYDFVKNATRILCENCELTKEEYHNYIGNKQYAYAWHIEDLEIFEEPLELSDFYRYDDNNHIPITKAPQKSTYVKRIIK